MKSRFLPLAEADRVVWLKNFSVKFPTYATTLNFTAADIAAVQNDTLMYEFIVNRVENLKTDLKKLVDYKRSLSNGTIGSVIGSIPAPTTATAPTSVGAGIFTRIGAIVARIKNHPQYTTAIGNDLGIIGSEQLVDFNSLKPSLKCNLEVGRPHLKWTKQGTDSIHLYADYKDGAGMHFITNTTRNEFLDTVALPTGGSAIWEYKAIYVIDDTEIGEFSDILRVTVSRLA